MHEIMANYLLKNLESVATHKNTSLAGRCKNGTKIAVYLEKLAGYVTRPGKIAEAFFGDFPRKTSLVCFGDGNEIAMLGCRRGQVRKIVVWTVEESSGF